MNRIIKRKIGFFRGFTESGLEFKADIVTPYNVQNHPIIGTFLLVSLDRETALLGRITKFYPVGIMSSMQGDDYLAQMGRMEREIPEDLKESKLRYNVSIRLLGIISRKHDKFEYSPSIRKLPHLGAWVGVPTEEVMQYICEIGVKGTSPALIGYMSFGDIVYDGLMQSPQMPIKFDIAQLVGKRTYVFARAGYGKSNLIKLLITRLYENNQPVGMIIFDPEGEYGFRDKKGRPGLLDIPFLREKILVFTNRDLKNTEYKKWIGGRVKINLADLHPSSVVSMCVSPEKQDTVFANRVRGASPENWNKLLQLLEKDGYRAEDSEIEEILHLKNTSDAAIISAVKNNIVPIVKTLHDSKSQLIEQIKYQLKKERIVIIDISQLSSKHGEWISGLILDLILKHNIDNFITGSSDMLIPTIAVIEEAQSVLSKYASESSPFVSWTKEGRKYELGSILVTQQPGAISSKLLSQGDNFFAFHLISASDLKELQKVNSNFSDDILSLILNEPIKGNAYFWSAPDQPFVISSRILNFEKYAEDTIGLQKGAPAQETEFKTPAEEFKEEMPGFDKEYTKIVMEIILNQSNVPVYDNVILDNEPREDLLALNKWNLLLTVGESLSGELERLYIEFFGDNKKKAKDSSLLDVLEERSILGKPSNAYNDERKSFLLLSKQEILKYKPKKIFRNSISLKSKG